MRENHVEEPAGEKARPMEAGRRYHDEHIEAARLADQKVIENPKYQHDSKPLRVNEIPHSQFAWIHEGNRCRFCGAAVDRNGGSNEYRCVKDKPLAKHAMGVLAKSEEHGHYYPRLKRGKTASQVITECDSCPQVVTFTRGKGRIAHSFSGGLWNRAPSDIDSGCHRELAGRFNGRTPLGVLDDANPEDPKRIPSQEEVHKDDVPPAPRKRPPEGLFSFPNRASEHERQQREDPKWDLTKEDNQTLVKPKHLHFSFGRSGLTESDIDAIIRDAYKDKNSDDMKLHELASGFVPFPKEDAYTNKLGVLHERIIRPWKARFSWNSPENTALQVVAGNRWKTHKWDARPEHIPEGIWADAHRRFLSNPKWVAAAHAALDAQNRQTLQRFITAGKRSVPLYRGMFNFMPDELVQKVKENNRLRNPLAAVSVQGMIPPNPLQGYSDHPRIATWFGGTNNRSGGLDLGVDEDVDEEKSDFQPRPSTMFATEVPAHHIVGSYRSSFGDPYLQEHVVRGYPVQGHLIHGKTTAAVLAHLKTLERPRVGEEYNELPEYLKYVATQRAYA